MLTVHHLNRSRSKRVLWLLAELKMPYDLIEHQRDSQTRLAPESLKAIHPLGKAPIIVDGDITLCESGAVMEYLLDKVVDHALRPARGSAEYYQYLEWLHFAEGSLGLPVISALMMSMEQRDGTKPMDGYIGKEIAIDFAYIDQTLSKRAFFAGNNFTAADIMMTVILEMADNLGLLVDKTHIHSYLDEMKKRQAYQLAASKG